MKQVIILLFSICLLTGCRDFGREVVDISFINKTDRQLLVNLQFQSVSDTCLWETTWSEDRDGVINPYSTFECRYIKKHLQNLIEGYGAVRFIIYDVDTIESVSWEKISEEYIIVKRIDFYSMDDLENEKCVITIE